MVKLSNSSFLCVFKGGSDPNEPQCVIFDNFYDMIGIISICRMIEIWDQRVRLHDLDAVLSRLIYTVYECIIILQVMYLSDFHKFDIKK